MFGNYKEELERRKAVVALLFTMSSIDGHIDPLERKFVYGVAQELGLDMATVQEVIAAPERFEIQPPPPEQERMSILYYVLFTMSVDGVIRKEEEVLCYKIGLKLGFNEHLTRDLINVMKRFLNKEIPSNALLDEVKKHMN